MFMQLYLVALLAWAGVYQHFVISAAVVHNNSDLYRRTQYMELPS